MAQINVLKTTTPGELQVHGSGTLVRWLLAEGLLDEITLLTITVILGQGKWLFPDRGPDIALDLLDSRPDSKGVLVPTYRPAARPTHPSA